MTEDLQSGGQVCHHELAGTLRDPRGSQDSFARPWYQATLGTMMVAAEGGERHTMDATVREPDELWRGTTRSSLVFYADPPPMRSALARHRRRPTEGVLEVEARALRRLLAWVPADKIRILASSMHRCSSAGVTGRAAKACRRAKRAREQARVVCIQVSKESKGTEVEAEGLP